jgi:hypothetical protein
MRRRMLWTPSLLSVRRARGQAAAVIGDGQLEADVDRSWMATFTSVAPGMSHHVGERFLEGEEQLVAAAGVQGQFALASWAGRAGQASTRCWPVPETGPRTN